MEIESERFEITTNVNVKVIVYLQILIFLHGSKQTLIR